MGGFFKGLVRGLTFGECNTHGCGKGHTTDIIDEISGKKKKEKKDKTGLESITDTLGVDEETLKNIGLLFGGMFLVLMLINIL